MVKKPAVDPLDVDQILSNFPAIPAPGSRVISSAPIMNAARPSAEVPVADAARPVSKRQFGIYARRVDKFSIKRTRVLMTPAVCPKCRLDLVALNNLAPWEDLATRTQEELIAGVAEHVFKVHDNTEQDIISEDELPKEYLGPKHVKQELRTQTR